LNGTQHYQNNFKDIDDMNTFNWKVSSNVLEMSPILHIKNAIPESVRTQLLAEVLNDRKVTNDSSGSEQHCWRGKLDSTNFSLDNIKFVDETILECYNLYINNLILPTNLYGDPENNFMSFANNPIINTWTNVNSKHGFNTNHTHFGSFISGVIYLQASGTGSIEFEPFNHTYKLYHPAWVYNGVSKYYPDDGDVLIFPSYLMHRVEPNPLDKERVNVAFNVTFER